MVNPQTDNGKNLFSNHQRTRVFDRQDGRHILPVDIVEKLS